MLDVVVVDDRDREAGKPLRKNDVLGTGVDYRLFIVAMGPAFVGGDEPGSHLHAGVSKVHHPSKCLRITDPSGTDDGQSKVAQLIDEGVWRQLTRVSAGHVVDRADQQRGLSERKL